MHLPKSHDVLISLFLLTPITSAYYLTPTESALYVRGYLDETHISSILFERRGEMLNAISGSAKGGEQTMQMLTTTPEGNHMLPGPIAKGAGAFVGAVEAVAFRNKNSAAPSPMAPVATTGKDRPKTEKEYVGKAEKLAVNTAKGPLGNKDAKSISKSEKIGAIQGKVAYKAGSLFDKAVDKFKGAAKKGKRSLDDEDLMEHLYIRELLDEAQEDAWHYTRDLGFEDAEEFWY